MKNILTINGIHIKDSPHEYLKQQLGLPDHYGENLDSLYDCLTEIGEETLIVVAHEEEIPSEILGVLYDASEENEYLTVQRLIRFNPHYEPYPQIIECPTRMWENRPVPLRNCSDTDPIDEAWEKLKQQRMNEIREEQKDWNHKAMLEQYNKTGILKLIKKEEEEG